MTSKKPAVPDPDPLEALAELDTGPRTLPLDRSHPLYEQQLPDLSDAVLVALELAAERAWNEARRSGGDVVAASGPRTKYQLAVSLRGLVELARRVAEQERGR